MQMRLNANACWTVNNHYREREQTKLARTRAEPKNKKKKKARQKEYSKYLQGCHISHPCKYMVIIVVSVCFFST